MTRHLKLTAAAAAAFVAAATLLPAPASAQDSIYIPLMTYRTGPYAGSGIPIADGMKDYLAMLNERDGGIGGVKLLVEECETGYDTKKGVECYEATKSKNPVMYNPYSTGITLQLIPKAAVDKIPILSMAYGLSAVAIGNTFPWVFNPPVTYWDGASVFVKHVADTEGGIAKLKGKKIGLVYLDVPYGKEPIPVLEALSKQYGFELKLYPIAAKEMQNQGSQWLNIRRDKPDWLYMQGWGAMNPTAVKEATKINFPMDHMVGVWWAGGDDDARGGGEEAKGYKSLNFHGYGANFPALQDIKKFVLDKGKSQYPAEKFGDNLYNRGVYNSMLIAEAIRNAQKLTGKKAVNGEDVRRGLETLDVSVARLKEIGMENFASPVKLACSNHSGHHNVYIMKWDGKKWVKSSDWMAPMKDVVGELLEQDAKDFVEKNKSWPKRIETCDKAA